MRKLVAIFLLFFALRFPSFFEPLWYGDEGIYQAIGMALNNGRQLYSEIFDNKPPLLYLTYAIFNSDQFTVRFASAIFGLLSIFVFFLLARKIFKNSQAFFTTLVFAVLFGLPTLEGNIANAENFMLLPILTSAFLILNLSPSPFPLPPFPLFIAGFLLGIAFLFKAVAIFDFTAFFVFLAIVNFASIKNIFKSFHFITGFFLPIALTSLFFIFNGAFVDFLKATFFTNVSYVSYGNMIGPFPLLLFTKLAILLGFTFFIFLKRKHLNKTLIFVLVWLAFSLFNSLFSQRPYTHYLLVLLPSFSFMLGFLFDKKYQKPIAVLCLVVLTITYTSFGLPNFKKSFFYYENFALYLMNKKTTSSYQRFFDKNTPVDYEIARFLKPKMDSKDTFFVWGNNAQLYKLVNSIPFTKYTVAYHITNYKDGITTTKNALEKAKPKFVVVMPNQGSLPSIFTNYSKKVMINNVVIYERIF